MKKITKTIINEYNADGKLTKSTETTVEEYSDAITYQPYTVKPYFLYDHLEQKYNTGTPKKEWDTTITCNNTGSTKEFFTTVSNSLCDSINKELNRNIMR